MVLNSVDTAANNPCLRDLREGVELAIFVLRDPSASHYCATVRMQRLFNVLRPWEQRHLPSGMIKTSSNRTAQDQMEPVYRALDAAWSSFRRHTPAAEKLTTKQFVDQVLELRQMMLESPAFEQAMQEFIAQTKRRFGIDVTVARKETAEWLTPLVLADFLDLCRHEMVKAADVPA